MCYSHTRRGDVTMIEVVYKEEKQEAKNGENLFNLPRNIRQVGLTTGNMRIYIEDYVYTFLTRLARNEISPGKELCNIAVFTGETKWNNGITYLFIRGALMVEDMEAAADHIDFSEKTWAKIQENQAKYFPGQEITGWFFSRPQLSMEADELLTRIHLRYFGGEKVLMLMEPAEKEEAFFFYENGLMVRQRGYYIYYEKNPLMQEYMIEKNKAFTPEFTENVADEAVVSFRKIIKNKKTGKPKKTEEKPQEEMEHTSVFSYAATACLVLAVLAVGAGFYRNYKGLTDFSQKDSAVTVTSDQVAQEEKITPEITWTTEENLSEDTQSSDENTESTPTAVPEVSEAAQETSAGQETDLTQETGTGWETNGAQETGTGQEVTGQQESAEGEDTSQMTEMPQNDGAASTTVGESITGTDTVESGTAAADSSQPIEEQQFSQEADERKVKKQETEASSDNVHESYMIKPGDTLYQISISHYGSTDAIPEICRLNNLTENQVIYPGQMIVLP